MEGRPGRAMGRGARQAKIGHLLTRGSFLVRARRRLCIIDAPQIFEGHMPHPKVDGAQGRPLFRVFRPRTRPDTVSSRSPSTAIGYVFSSQRESMCGRAISSHFCTKCCLVHHRSMAALSRRARVRGTQSTGWK